MKQEQFFKLLVTPSKTISCQIYLFSYYETKKLWKLEMETWYQVPTYDIKKKYVTISAIKQVLRLTDYLNKNMFLAIIINK